MEIIRDSSLEELSRQFWERQANKDQNGKDVIANIKEGGNAYEWLKRQHPYKLPLDHNNIVKIAYLDRAEVGALIMREDTVSSRNEWMNRRGLVPNPFTQVLSELAAVARSRGYFINRKENDTQLRKYREWK